MKTKYTVNTGALRTSSAISEASKEELRVLLTLISLGGEPTNEGEISRIACTSAPRTKAAIAFWEGAEILKTGESCGIVEEFEERLLAGEIDEEPAIRVADTVRDECLASLLSDCAAFLGVAALSTQEVKNITALVSQYKLPTDYILTLAAHLKSKDKFSVRQLCNKAISLDKSGISETATLDEYLKNLENGNEWEFRRVLGIYGNISKSQREFIRKWSEEFGYSTEILAEAYDIAMLNTGKADFRYIDSVLSGWHEAGCKTVSQCLAHNETGKAARAQKTEKKYSKSKPETPRYGNFDVNEAFQNALERSFGEKDED